MNHNGYAYAVVAVLNELNYQFKKHITMKNESNNNPQTEAMPYDAMLAAGRSLTKDEAKQALKEFYKVSHRFFAKDEYIYAFNDWNVFTEEGFSIDSDTFWGDRSGKQWDTDWFILPE